jgi:UDP-N-acetylmuramoyl-tripeptide--D-alanyl-D-alanine ligase
MAELGEFEGQEHRKAGETAAANADVIVCSGPVCRPLFEAARAAGHADAHWFETKEEAAAYVAGIQGEGDFVLVKASRGEAFEDILPLLEAAK